MAKKGLSGIALARQRNTMGKNYTSSEITDRFIEWLLGRLREGTEPPEWRIAIGVYHQKYYTLDRDWYVWGFNGEKMKYLSLSRKKAPRVRIHKLIKDPSTWEIINKEVEINVLKLMEKEFWPYFPGYSKARLHPDEYMLIPADDNWENLSWKNLVFIPKKEYRELGTKKALVKMFFELCPWLTDQEVAEKTGVSRTHVWKVRKELESEGLLKPQLFEQVSSVLWFNVTSLHVRVYEYFMNNGADKTNLEIAKELFPEEAWKATTNAAKKLLTAPIVRIKKRLIEKGVLEESPLQKYREQVLELLENKEVNQLTNQQIADQFGLKKEQVDNLSRTLISKKKGSAE